MIGTPVDFPHPTNMVRFMAVTLYVICVIYSICHAIQSRVSMVAADGLVPI